MSGGDGTGFMGMGAAIWLTQCLPKK